MKKILRLVIGIIVIFLTIVFFVMQVVNNWSELRETVFTINVWYAVCAVMFMVLTYCAHTYTWHCLINETHKATNQITLKQSMGVFNITNLTKYIPGKVWAYGIQMYILSKNGFSAAKVLFVNVLLLLLTISIVCVAAFYYILFNFIYIDLLLKYLIVVVSSIVCVLCLIYIEKALYLLIKIIKKVVKRDFSIIVVPRQQILKAIFILVISHTFFILSVVFICFATGIEHNIRYCIEIGFIGVISSIIGFFALFAPGGLGVQEASMYALLITKFGITVAVLLPIILRMIILISDVVLTLISYLCIRKDLKGFLKKKQCKKIKCSEE
ncbi:MAG: flippase-like domain-containing protein [Oscillospiraceae bacterium]|nr:flippase-like domain-containing protein [Oscillospiraceae bacterium]